MRTTPLRRLGRAGAALALAVLALAGCSDDDGGTASTDATAPAPDEPLPAVEDLPAPDDTICLAVRDLADADARIEAILEEGRVEGTTEALLAGPDYAAATGDLAAASAVYLATAPAEVGALAIEKERLDDAVGQRLLAAGSLDDEGRDLLDRAKEIDDLLLAYGERWCEVAAAPA